MTQAEFNNLHPLQQEAFLSEGGMLSAEFAMPTAETGKVGLSKDLGCPLDSNDGGVSSTTPLQPSPPSPYMDGFDIKSPLELLFLLDDEVRNGIVTLEDWQIQFLIDFASEDKGQSDTNPFQALVRAANGSGKDKYIIAPCVVWLCMRYKKSRGIVTSASGQQLNTQTCRYITMLCHQANQKFGNIWKCNYRAYTCLPTESPIECFATDEAGKAEGFHPLVFGAKMGIFESESKTVEDTIFIAQNKCTGYTHRVLVSTPGQQTGHFYDLCQVSPIRLDETGIHIQSLKEVSAIDYIQYHITANMCKHLSPTYFEQMKRDLPGGEFGAAYKSQIRAEFGTTDEMVVIPYNQVWKCRHNNTKWEREEHNTGGLDLSDGGAETVLVVRNGNKVLKVVPFRFDDTEDTIKFLEETFRSNNLVHSKALIFGDCVGIGGPILKRLRRKKWSNIRFFDSRHAAYHKSTYFRRGDEVWFDFAKLVARKEIILPDDLVLVKQLAGRYYKITEGKHKLLSKQEQKSKGYASPDRADALVYAFSNYKSEFIEADPDADAPIEVEEEQQMNRVGDLTLKGLASGFKDEKMRRWNVNGGQRDFSYVQDAIADYNKRILENK